MGSDNEDGAAMFARTPGTPNSDEGMHRELKTTVPDDLADEFLLASHHNGGRAGVLRDLVCVYVHGVPFAEHVAKSRRANDAALGQVIAHCAKGTQQ